MANIPLRAYNREVDNMINQGRIDEAIAHSRHIMKYFPKHLETYRLLGKAFLESQRFSDAADIFQRILSSVPDDFVAHIGMSIIREDEGNLDAALWHMERVFDVQPSNGAIQDELKRLYGKRDGLEPPKIRMTRSALARMYAQQGNLFEQAISEARSALAENPRRLDMQVLLTRLYDQNSQPVDAAQAASQLLIKLPYCLEANRVIAKTLETSDRKAEAETHRQRVQELDPYLIYLSKEAPAPELVPEAAVSLPKLDWQPNQQDVFGTNQPAWASSLGLEINAQTDHETPEWLLPETEDTSSDFPLNDGSATHDNELNVREDSIPDDASDFDEEVSSHAMTLVEGIDMTEENIPDWMKDAGWEPRGPNEPEEPTSFELGDEDSSLSSKEADEIEEADIPEWLKSIAPPSGSTESDDVLSESAIENNHFPDWLEEIGTQAEDEEADESPEWSAMDTLIQKKDSILRSDDLPEWLKDLDKEDTIDAYSTDDTLMMKRSDNDAPLDWLGSLDDAGETPSDEEQTPTMDWLNDLDKVEEPEAESTSLPAWIETGLQEEVEETTDDEEIDAIPGEIPDWMQTLKAVESTEEEMSEAEEMPEWLRSITVEDEEAAEDLIDMETLEPGELETILAGPAPEASSLSEDKDDMSSWLLSLDDEDTEEDSEELPDWLRNMATDAAEEVIGDKTGAEDILQAAISAVHDDDVEVDSIEDFFADQFDEVSEDEITKETIITSMTDPTEQAETEDEIPDWLQGMEDEIEEEESAVELSFDEDEQRVKAPDIASEDLEEDLEPAVPAELPEWLLGLSEGALSAEISELISDEIAEEIPDSMDATIITDEVHEITRELDETPEASFDQMDDADSALAWLESLAAKQGVDEEQLLTPIDKRSELPPTWVQDMIEPEEETAETMESEIAEPLDEVFAAVEDTVIQEEEVFQVEETIEATTAQFSEDMDADAALAWLENLASKHGVSEEELLTPIEDRRESPPNWVLEEVAAETEEEEIEEIEIFTEEEPEEEVKDEAMPAVMFEDTAEEIEEDDSPVMDEAAALAWLQSLSEKGGLDESDLISEGELPTEVFIGDKVEELPAWLAQVEDEDSKEVEEIPDWMASTRFTSRSELDLLPAEDIEDSQKEFISDEEELGLPEWLEQDVAAEQEPVEIEEAVPDWIEPVVQEATSDVEEISEVEPEIPEWFVEVAAEEAVEPWSFVPEEAIKGEYEETSEEVTEWVADESAEETAVQEEVEALVEYETVGEQEIEEPEEAPIPTGNLQDARTYLESGNVDEAVETYEALIEHGEDLDQIISDLQKALEYRYPVHVDIWQTLGDAYMRNDQLQDALDAFTKAEELLR